MTDRERVLVNKVCDLSIFYVSVDLPIKEDKVCSFLGLDGFQQK